MPLSKLSIPDSQEKVIYVHYGTNVFDPAQFIRVRNCSWMAKPEPGTGFWASREDDPDGWANWCKQNHYLEEDLHPWLRFLLADNANVLELVTPDQLETLSKTQPWKVTDAKLSDPPTMEELTAYFTPEHCYLDFEKLDADGVDAIELRNYFLFQEYLPTWDCNCILILHPDIIIECPNRESMSED